MKTTDFIIEVRFPKLNKNCNLADNDLEISLRNNVETCRVVKVVNLSHKEWEEVSSDFLSSRPELWGGIGGQSLSDGDKRDFRALCDEHGADKDNWQT